jgi:hypothetical protein
LVPLPIIDLPVFPGIDSFAMRFTILKLSEVSIAIRIPFEAFAIPKISVPEPFILAAIPVLHDTFAMPFGVNDSAHVYSIFIPHFLVSIDLRKSF